MDSLIFDDTRQEYESTKAKIIEVMEKIITTAEGVRFLNPLREEMKLQLRMTENIIQKLTFLRERV
jgi:hypothetical protein